MMRTKPANRYHSQQSHNQYGIYNWFKGKGVTNQQTIQEVVYAFCEHSGFKGLSPDTKEQTKLNCVGNRFSNFASFAMNYMKQNNYIA